jgi:hypothetical protein
MRPLPITTYICAVYTYIFGCQEPFWDCNAPVSQFGLAKLRGRVIFGSRGRS